MSNKRNKDHLVSSRSSRRDVLKKAVLATAAFTIVPRHVLGGPGFVAPSDRVHVGVVGVGGRGKENVKELLNLPDVVITSIADPAEFWDLAKFYYKGTAGRSPVAELISKHYSANDPNFKVAQYEDFREMLDQQKELDAVLCATPDHNHAFVSIQSMKAGKHVYCEKPLTHNVWEARLVAKVAAETGVATQMGNQGHANETLRQAVEWIRDGAIGKVQQVHAWAAGSRWNPELTGKPSAQPIPRGLNWDLWLGTREPWDFSHALAPVAWRDFWPFGLGNLGDIGCHDLDSAVWALNLKSPKTVEVQSVGNMNQDIAPHGELGYYRFENDGDQVAVDLYWYGGGPKPRRPVELPAGKTLPKRGTLFIGEKGKMLCGGAGASARLLPENLDSDYNRPEPSLPRAKGHHREWVDAIKGGPAAMSDFAYGAKLTEIILLGCTSLRIGKPIDWDYSSMSATNAPEAEAILKEGYRQGWEL
jgi:predicted dehydrogenase